LTYRGTFLSTWLMMPVPLASAGGTGYGSVRCIDDLILIRYRGLSAVRTAVSPGRWRASGAKGCVLSGLVSSGASKADDSTPSTTPG
jgi:hypothetical protein